MADNLSSSDRQKTMRAVKSKKTTPERRIRALLVSRGFRGWRVNYDEVEGIPDFVFIKERVAIFVDGCFWHGCPECNRPLPKTNKEYWKKKIGRNIERDKINREKLTSDGWKVMNIWEHELRKDLSLEPIVNRIMSLL